MPINFDRQNDRVTEWANKVTGKIKDRANALGIRHRANSPSPSASVPAIKDRFRLKGGIIEIISFRFSRSLIWPHKGAGRGYGGIKGSTWKDKLGITHHTDPKSLGKMGTGNRTAKPWFNDVMEGSEGVDQLANIVAEESGDGIINKLLIN
jgi:hypothetical protein